jgi:3D (Asp-Asp-Asp) domain-containing protein
MSRLRRILLFLALLVIIWRVSKHAERPRIRSLAVTATAYNSLPAQTHPRHPNIAAWGDTLYPGMQVIAVSRDLLDTGLVHNTEVKIAGLPGTYRVLDKMNQRWRKRIDIYMGVNRDSALQWGKQEVIISWEVPAE